MLKKLSSLALCIFLASTTFASPVDEQAALSAAKAFLNEKGLSLNISERMSHRAKKANNNENDSYYYIFNSTNGGYVIASGDDKFYPILGYSDKGYIDFDNMPEGLESLLQSYKDAIDAFDNNADIATSQATRRSMSLAKYPIKPFLTKHWGQLAPFSSQNPKVNNTFCPCGCLTAVVGEIVGYYEYPTTLPSTTAYTTEMLGLEIPALPSYDIDWMNMLTNYSTQSYTDTEKAEASRFMNHLACLMKSDFFEDYTPTPVTNMTSAFKAMGYTTSSLTKHSSKMMNDWDEIIYDDLTNKRPVLLTGCNIKVNGSRHAFILDGYDQDGLYHVDWGFDGNANGFYRLSLLSPYNNTSSYTYMKDLYILYNIQPKVNGSIKREVPQFACLQTLSLSVSDNNLVIQRRNTTGAANSFKYGIALVDQDFNMLKVLAWDTLTYKAGQTVKKTWSVDDVSDIIDGTYRIYPVSQLLEGDGMWHFDQNNATYSCAQAEVANGSAKLTAMRSITYNSFEYDTSLQFVKGAARRFTLNYTNNTMEKLNRRIYLFEDDTPIQYTIINAPPTGSAEAEFFYFPQATGDFTLKLCTDTARTKIIYEIPVKVVSGISNKLTVDEYEIDNYDKENKMLYGNTFRIKVKITNTGSKDYNDYIRFLMRHGSWYDTKKPLVSIKAGESEWFEFESKDLIYKDSYPFDVRYKTSSTADPNTFSTNILSLTIQPREGIRMWDTAGKLYASAPTTEEVVVPENILAIDLSNENIDLPANVVPNSNPNTLYYVSYPIPSLEGRNQIVNGVADSIKLDDNYSCYIPIDFKADRIKYTRTFEKGFMGRRNQNNWSTIVLPFTVQRVYNTVDSVDIDWYKPGDDPTDFKNFWVREFYAEEGLHAYFTSTDQILANVPYIITVPGEYVAEDTCLVGKPLEFSAGGVDVISNFIVADGNNYNFQGSLSTQDVYGKYIFMLDEEDRGNHFIYNTDSTTVAPFRAYFTSDTKPRENAILRIASYVDLPRTANTDGIKVVAADTPRYTAVYNINGVAVRTAPSDLRPHDMLTGLPKGIYIINGKKYMT